MRLPSVWLALLLGAPIAHAGPPPSYVEKNVTQFLRTSDLTALVRISGYTVDKEIPDAFSGVVGYIRFKVRGEVTESFRGVVRGPITFYVTQEQPSDPPRSGDYIVSLNKVGDELVFADESVWWVKATPELVDAARRAR